MDIDAAPALQSDRTTLRRRRDRGEYSREIIDSILDEALICHVGITQGSSALVLPTIHARIEDHVYLHGAASNHLIREIARGAEACVSVTILDGLVLARSAFHHSMNYRSVVLLGRGELVRDEAEKLRGVEAIVEHVVAGRSVDARPPSVKELQATLVVRIPIEEASAKIRTGPPLDDEEDLTLPIWAGVIPVSTTLSAGIADPVLDASVEPPGYVTDPTPRGAFN